MPTPSSGGDNESLSFNTTCPDEQAPRAQSSWRDPSAASQSHDASDQPAGSMPGSSSNHNSNSNIPETLASPSLSVGGEVSSSSARTETTMSPGAESSGHRSSTHESESMFVNSNAQPGDAGEDDDVNKQPDADDEDMPDSVPSDIVIREMENNRVAVGGGDGGADADNVAGGGSGSASSVTATTMATAMHNDPTTHEIRILSRIGRSITSRRGYRSFYRGLSRSDPRYYLDELEIREPMDAAPPARRSRFDVSANAMDEGSLLSPDDMDDDGRDDMAELDGDHVWLGTPTGDMWADPTALRVIPISPLTYLRPGSRFTGTQESERQIYEVQVEIKHVDLRESFLCGYLRIQGLTEHHPTLTTYFEGEIIGPKYGFNTKHPSWGANESVDMSHWSKFTAFRQIAKQIKKGNFVMKEHKQKEHIFMRWKEHFLVPDHHVRTIHGASFEGFYYICFNQLKGLVNGIYFHSKSEKFQQLQLRHVEDKGCMNAVEFR